MKKLAVVLSCLPIALAMPAPAQSTYHYTCMRMAEYECQNWEDRGFPDFATCGNAVYEECMRNFGQTGGGGIVFGPDYGDKVNYCTGRITCG